MKMIIVVALAFVALAAAAPPLSEPIKILRSEFEQQPDGSFVSSYETENGIQSQTTGVLKEALDEDNKPHTVLVLRGSYSYPDAEGRPITIEFVADENGFQPTGDSIPKGPARR